ncbi:unnamed protein product [Linum trigynum]|uniref:Uncharacterized protein n=1 Tax=Linum trigynum TaxID=586398 RepID=A0AAV2D0H0_9ROSI
MAPLWKNQASLRPSGGFLEDQSVDSVAEKSRLIVDGWYAAEEEDEDESEGGRGLGAMMKNLMSIAGARRMRGLTVYIDKGLRKRKIPHKYTGFEGFRQLLPERIDADTMDWKSCQPFEIESCTAQRFREILRAAVEEEEMRRRYRL